MNMCKYKDIFGAPNTGVHKYRLFDIAIVDTVLTIIGGYMLHRYTNISLVKVLAFLFILGVLMHRIFCVRTTIDKWVFIEKGSNVVFFLVIFSILKILI